MGLAVAARRGGRARFDRGLKRSDCSLVLTTSKGAVTTDPHIPPRLRGRRVSRAENEY